MNGERVDGPRVLTVGDSIRIGSTTLQLSGVARAPDPPAALTDRPTPAPVAAPAPPTPRAAPAPPAPLATPAPPTPRPARPMPRQVPAVPAPDRQLPPSALPLDSVFAGCRVEEVIGHGDMGVVYRAEELALQRRVALKLILPEHSRDDRFRERFRRESRIAAAIDHPNIIPIFDAGDENGVLYITMRLVNGTDLRALIAAEGRIEPLRAARIVRQVGAGLDAAHARGMLHRDVKPSNVLLAREDHVYLSDFGLAKRQSGSAVGLTRHGSIVARAEYVAPEQVLNERVDARADIYTLGCLLFETLTGETPFARWDGGPEALAHVSAPRPSVTELCPDLPREFDEVVRRAMATEPSERYPSAGDLGRAALVAAGGLRKARPWSVVATGDGGSRPQRTDCGEDRARARARAARARGDGDRSCRRASLGNRRRRSGARGRWHGQRADGDLEPLTVTPRCSEDHPWVASQSHLAPGVSMGQRKLTGRRRLTASQQGAHQCPTGTASRQRPRNSSSRSDDTSDTVPHSAGGSPEVQGGRPKDGSANRPSVTRRPQVRGCDLRRSRGERSGSPPGLDRP